MARHDMNTMMTTGEMVAALAAMPFKAVFDAIVRSADRSSRMTALNQINAMSDADLAARGLTRTDATQMVMRSPF